MLIPLFGTGQKGQSEILSAQNRINCYVELPKDAEKAQVTVLPMPGLREVVDLDDYATTAEAWSGAGAFNGPIRAMRLMSSPADFAYFGPWVAIVRGEWVVQLHAYEPFGADTFLSGVYIAGSGLLTGPLASHTTRARVDITDDGLGGIFLCNGTDKGAYGLPIAASSFTSSGVTWDGSLLTAVSDADAETNTYCTSIGQRIVTSVLDKKYFRYSTDQEGTAWDALDFETPDAYPDGTLRVFNHRGTLIAFGEQSIEFYSLSGDPDSPYAPIRGATVPIGLSAPWSLVQVAGDAVFLGRTASGTHQVFRLSGMSASIVSDQQIDYLFNAYETVSDATALTYSVGGHTFYQINFPTEDVSWALDITTGVWSQMVGPDGGRHPAEYAVTFANRVLVGHHTTGQVFVMETDQHEFAGEEMPREITTRHFFKDFDRVIVDELVVDFDVGLGNEAGSDPQVMLQISKDNGKSWGNELWKSLGKIGETKTRVVWRRLGQGRDWTFRLRVTDPVRFVIAGASINAQPVVG